MNNLEALIIVRGAARVSGLMRTRQGVAAGKVVDRKIQSLMRKKAWRDGCGATPVHMGDDDFRYEIPDDPITAALKELLDAEAAFSASIQDVRTPRLQDAVEAARTALRSLENGQHEPRSQRE